MVPLLDVCTGVSYASGLGGAIEMVYIKMSHILILYYGLFYVEGRSSKGKVPVNQDGTHKNVP